LSTDRTKIGVVVMLKSYNPSTVAPPFSRYSHGVEAPANARWLHISGQVGVKPDGRVAEGAEAQMEQAWRNIFALLEAAGMTKRDLVKVTAFLTVDAVDIGLFRRVRDRMLEGAAPATTGIFVAGLANPEWLVEIEATAAAE
jgi:2-iminobutanoate/2-iminopropanoate deaminase